MTAEMRRAPSAHMLELTYLGSGATAECSCGWIMHHPRPSVAQRMHREHAEAAMRSARRQS